MSLILINLLLKSIYNYFSLLGFSKLALLLLLLLLVGMLKFAFCSAKGDCTVNISEYDLLEELRFRKLLLDSLEEV